MGEGRPIAWSGLRRSRTNKGSVDCAADWRNHAGGRYFSDRWGAFAMPKTTPATTALRKLGIAFKLHTYVYDSTAEHIGLQAAEALDVEPNRVLKTLMVEVDGSPVCVVVPADSEISMKKLAAAMDAKAAKMMQPSDAERITGYHVGGISPFGQKKKVPVAIDQTALTHTTVFVNGGQRGLQIEIDPNDAALAAGAVTHALTAE
jgi:Cys-tRNA(Pro)/Cys-tRNA(Cys) deacylase